MRVEFRGRYRRSKPPYQNLLGSGFALGVEASGVDPNCAHPTWKLGVVYHEVIRIQHDAVGGRQIGGGTKCQFTSAEAGVECLFKHAGNAGAVYMCVFPQCTTT